MCGLSVVVGLDTRRSADERLLAMHEAAAHRGPDGEGFLRVDAGGRATPGNLRPRGPWHLGIAFRRLKVLDPAEGAAQPMVSTDGRRWIAYNGEIYNFRDLRRDLERRGRAFRTRGDTEVVLAGFEEWGEQVFERLEGMWALVIADLPARRVVASRDRLGIKPLYWARDGSILLLGSEIKQVVAGLSGSLRPHHALVGQYLRGNRYPAREETFFQDVRAVPPATWFEVPLQESPPAPLFRSFWDLAAKTDPAHRAPAAYGEAREAMEALLAQLVREHRVADVKVGALLSGGLDSATLVSYLAAQLHGEGTECPTFSFGFGATAPDVCELEHARAVARHAGTRHYEATFGPDWVRDHLVSVVRTLEEPPLGMAALAQYRVFERCRAEGVTVVLDGQGADEVFAGYPYHQRMLVWDRLRGGRPREAWREISALRRRCGAGWMARQWLGEPLRRRMHSRDGWLRPALPSHLSDEERRQAAADQSRDPSRLNRELYRSLRSGNIRIVVPYSDKNAMAHSVEARVPYLDRRLVEFAFALPDHYKAGAGDRKRILRDLARRRLPPQVTERTDRMGFATPDARWLRRELWPSVREAVHDSGLLGGPWFRPRPAARFLEDFGRNAHDDFRAVWRLWALAAWQQAFGLRAW